MFAQSLRRGVTSSALRLRAVASVSASANAAAASVTRRALSAAALRSATATATARPAAAAAVAALNGTRRPVTRARATVAASPAAPSLQQLRGLLHARFNSTAPAAAAAAAPAAAAPAAAAAAPDVTTPIVPAAAPNAAPFVDPAEAAVSIAGQTGAATSLDAGAAVVATGAAVLTDAAAAQVPWAWWQYPMVGMSEVLNWLHTSTGLPWWGTIVLGTVALRLLILPINVMQQKLSAKMSYMQPELERWKTEYMQLQIQGKLNKETADHMKLQMSAIQEKHGVKGGTLRMFSTVFITMPLFMSTFFALRRPEFFGSSFKVEGTGWFPDLSSADPYWGLPTVSGVTMAAAVKWGSDMSASNDPMKKRMTNLFIGLSILSIYATSGFPAGVCLYWLTANTMSIANGYLLRRPQVRQLLSIPPMYVPPPRSTTRAAYNASQFATSPLPPGSAPAKELAAAAEKAKPAPVVPLVRHTHRPVRPGTAEVTDK